MEEKMIAKISKDLTEGKEDKVDVRINVNPSEENGTKSATHLELQI